MHHRILGVVAAALLVGPAAAQSGLTINANTVIVKRADAPGPVKKAADDLASDMEKVSGKRPQIVAQASGPAIEIAAPTGGATESFSITMRGNHVVLSGADMRGTIFAIYTFSQERLGTDPMYYWNDHQPEKKPPSPSPRASRKTIHRPCSNIAAFSSMTKTS